MNTMKNILLALVVACLFYPTLLTASEKTLEARLQDCVQMVDNLNRLACFDNLARNVRVDFSSTASTDDVVTDKNTALPAPKQQIDDFAKTHLASSASEKVKEIQEITAQIVKLTKLIRGQYTLTLDKEQVRQQKDRPQLTLKVGQRVVIAKGALGSFYLKKSGSRKRIQVRRIK